MSRKKILLIHLWLGLTTGLLVFVIAITGCIYAFKDEIQFALQDFRKVEVRDASFLPPTKIRDIAYKIIPDKELHAVMYPGKEFAAKAIFYKHDGDYYDIIYINPYDGKVLKVKDEACDFFRIVLMGHYYLFLPPAIGQPVVAYTTLLFFVIVLSGLIIWIPKQWKQLKQRFTIKWNAKWRRVNYDLHQVVGIYTCLFALVFIVTGLMWGLQWFRVSVYNGLSDKKFVEYYEPSSTVPTTRMVSRLSLDEKIDFLWNKLRKSYPSIGSLEVHFPEDSTHAISINYNPDVATLWKIDYLYFNQYTLEEIKVEHPWGKLANTSKVDLMYRMNYDIHVGAIGGLPGKIIAFITSLLIASLPVTGVLLWIGKKYKK